MVPFFALRGCAIEDFEREGDTTRIHLEGGVLIESTLAAKSIRIALNGTRAEGQVVDERRNHAMFYIEIRRTAPTRT